MLFSPPCNFPGCGIAVKKNTGSSSACTMCLQVVRQYKEKIGIASGYVNAPKLLY